MKDNAISAYVGRASRLLKSPCNSRPVTGLKLRIKAGVRLLSPHSNELVLDAGCHSAYLLEALQSSGVSSVVGIDISLPLLKEGKAKNAELPLILADVQALPFTDAVFDKIACLDLIEHVENDFQAINELSRILKKKGLLVISTPNDLQLLNLWDSSYLCWKILRSRKHRHRHYSQHVLTEMLERANLRTHSIYTYGSIYYVLLRWSYLLRRRLKITPRILIEFLVRKADKEFDHPRKIGIVLFACAKK